MAQCGVGLQWMVVFIEETEEQVFVLTVRIIPFLQYSLTISDQQVNKWQSWWKIYVEIRYRKILANTNFASCPEQGEHAEVFFLRLQTKLQYTQLVVYISGEFCM